MFPKDTMLNDDSVQDRTISVVIPARNAKHHIGDCLKSILYQQVSPPKEVIVVDDGSTDGTYLYVREYFPDVVVIPIPFGGMAIARNTGLEYVNGQIVVFTDSDCVADYEWLRKLEKVLEDKKCAIQGNFYAQYFDTKLTQYHARWRRSVHIQKNQHEVGETEIFLKTLNLRNAAISRKVLDKINNMYGFVFDPKQARGADDLEFSVRLLAMGEKIFLEEDAIVYHKDSTKLLEIMKQKYRHGYYAAEAGFAEKLFDVENFRRMVINPRKQGVPIFFSLAMWLAYTYGFQRGLK